MILILHTTAFQHMQQLYIIPLLAFFHRPSSYSTQKRQAARHTSNTSCFRAVLAREAHNFTLRETQTSQNEQRAHISVTPNNQCLLQLCWCYPHAPSLWKRTEESSDFHHNEVLCDPGLEKCTMMNSRVKLMEGIHSLL